MKWRIITWIFAGMVVGAILSFSKGNLINIDKLVLGTLVGGCVGASTAIFLSQFLKRT
jgi:hypothetical protein